jgi:hypothetical protein
MRVDLVGEVVPEYVNQAKCRTKIKMDNLWECLADAPACCPHLVSYGPMKYCTHKNAVGFGVGVKRRVEGPHEW